MAEVLIKIRSCLEKMLYMNESEIFKKQTQEYISNLNDQIYKLCYHEFTTDLFDINPEKSITITYCEYCSLSKR